MKNITKIIITVWVALWLFFLIREDKDGQYAGLRYMYTHHDAGEKEAYLLDRDLYDFLLFCKTAMSEGSTYQLLGFEKYAISEVRARYLLWPLRMVDADGDFIIFWNQKNARRDGYETYREFSGRGSLLMKAEG